MALPEPYAVETVTFEAAKSGSTELIGFNFSEVPPKDDIVVVIFGLWYFGGVETPTIDPGLNVVPDQTADWTELYDLNGNGNTWGVWHRKADGVSSGWSIWIDWKDVSNGSKHYTAVWLKNIDPEDPTGETAVDDGLSTSTNGVDTPSISSGTRGQSFVMSALTVGSAAAAVVYGPGVGSGTFGTVVADDTDWALQRNDYVRFASISTFAGTTRWTWSNAVNAAAVVVDFINGTTAPGVGSIRKLGQGWAHLPDFENVNWAAEGRVVTWGNVRRKDSSAKRGFSNGIDALEIADTDLALWGSTYDAGESSMLWRKLQINSKWTSETFGTAAGTMPLAIGRVVEFSHRENKVKLGLYDAMDDLSNAQFLWDYVPLYATTGTFVYGTVVEVRGSSVIVEESPDDDLKKTLNTIETLDTNRRTFTEKWVRLGNLGVIGTDSLVPGDRLKFFNSALAATDAGSVLLTENEYTVQSGSFFISKSSAHQGTFGTIMLQAAPVGVNNGDFVYKRSPLWYRGNPAEIVRTILTGSNTTLRLGTDTINGTYYGAATNACAPMNFEALITDEGQGGLVNAIKAISDPVDAVFFFDRVGSFCWLPFRPRTRDDADFVSERYDGTMFGGTAGTGNMWGANFMTDISDVVTDITFNYDYNHYEDEDGIPYKGQVRRQNLNTATRFRGYRNAATINTQWVKDDDDAIVLAEHKLRMATFARPKYEFQTSLYGIEQDLYQNLLLTHRTGSMKDAAWQVSEIDFDIDADSIAIRLRDISDVYLAKGYGYFEDGVVGTHSVSGTSRSGWGWASPEHGTIHGAIGSLGTIGVLLDVNGTAAALGTTGITKYFTIGSEIMKVTTVAGASATLTFERGFDVSEVGTHSAGDGWSALPMDSNDDLIALWNGTEMAGTPVFGTVLNINTGTFGTVWRFW